MALVTLAVAKSHLRVTDDDSNADIQLKAEQASAVVIKHLKSQAVAGWSTGAVVVPSDVEAATLLMLGHLWENRGDEMKSGTDAWLAVERLLVGWRDPTLA